MMKSENSLDDEVGIAMPRGLLTGIFTWSKRSGYRVSPTIYKDRKNAKTARCVAPRQLDLVSSPGLRQHRNALRV